MVGTGPGGRDYLLPAAEAAVAEADVLVGGKNALALFESLSKERHLIGRDLDEALDFIEAARQEKRVCVLLSGDPCFFSLLPRLQRRLGTENLRIIPGISSLQVACSRIGLAWNDLLAVSVHGRDISRLAEACSRDRVAVLTDNRFTPAEVCKFFLERGCHFDRVWVFTDLGLPGETVTSTTLEEGTNLKGRGNSIVILLRERSDASAGGIRDAWWGVVTPGLPDELFVRGAAAMSQEEARALTLCKARLRRGMVVYEIGAGTGAWTVEVARLIAPGTVWAVERDPEAVLLVRSNIEKFGLSNVVLVEGEAPSACATFPSADCVLVGGSGGKLGEILDAAGRWLRPGGTLVVTAVTPDTFSAAWEILGGGVWKDRQAVLINCARVAAKGKAEIWQGENPIFILRAERSGGGQENA